MITFTIFYPLDYANAANQLKAALKLKVSDKITCSAPGSARKRKRPVTARSGKRSKRNKLKIDSNLCPVCNTNFVPGEEDK